MLLKLVADKIAWFRLVTLLNLIALLRFSFAIMALNDLMSCHSQSLHESLNID